MHIFLFKTEEIFEKYLILYLFITLSVDTPLNIHAALVCMSSNRINIFICIPTNENFNF